MKGAAGAARPPSPDPLPSPPDWIPSAEWDAWVQHRREKRKPLTATQATAQFATLAKYRSEGHDPADVLRHSVAGGYQGLFPPDKRANGGGSSRRSALEDSADALGLTPDDFEEVLGGRH